MANWTFSDQDSAPPYAWRCLKPIFKALGHYGISYQQQLFDWGHSVAVLCSRYGEKMVIVFVKSKDAQNWILKNKGRETVLLPLSKGGRATLVSKISIKLEELRGFQVNSNG